ncbi:GtrA family protein [Streptomycetaceae bacterium NBC_01309]
MQNQRLQRLTAHPMFPELAKFAVIGGFAYLTDLILFNILRTQTGYGPLTAKALSLVASIVVGFVGNRYWTYRERAGDEGALQVTKQGLAFVGVTQVGNLIQMTFLAFSHYVLGMTSLLADNVFGNVVGMGVATVFRFWGYRTWVFRRPEPGAGAERPAEFRPEPLAGTTAVPSALSAPPFPSASSALPPLSAGSGAAIVPPAGRPLSEEVLEGSGRR